MYNNFNLIQKGKHYYVDSREVAALIGKAHKNLLRDINGYINHMRKSIKLTFEPNDFFLESTYVDNIGRTLPCYLISKSGCEICANKLNGEKGVLFTAAYVSKFNEMEIRLNTEREKESQVKLTLSDCNDTTKIIVDQLKAIGVTTDRIIDILNELYIPVGVRVADKDELSNIPRTFTALQIAKIFGIYSIYGRPHAMAVSCILNKNIFIADTHKILVSANYENEYARVFRYDEYAMKRVGEWLDDYDYPNEIYGFKCTYRIIYSSQKHTPK